jgi:hypothetical protein
MSFAQKVKDSDTFYTKQNTDSSNDEPVSALGDNWLSLCTSPAKSKSEKKVSPKGLSNSDDDFPALHVTTTLTEKKVSQKELASPNTNITSPRRSVTMVKSENKILPKELVSPIKTLKIAGLPNTDITSPRRPVTMIKSETKVSPKLVIGSRSFTTFPPNGTLEHDAKQLSDVGQNDFEEDFGKLKQTSEDIVKLFTNKINLEQELDKIKKDIAKLEENRTEILRQIAENDTLIVNSLESSKDICSQVQLRMTSPTNSDVEVFSRNGSLTSEVFSHDTKSPAKTQPTKILIKEKSKVPAKELPKVPAKELPKVPVTQVNKLTDKQNQEKIHAYVKLGPDFNPLVAFLTKLDVKVCTYELNNFPKMYCLNSKCPSKFHLYPVLGTCSKGTKCLGFQNKKFTDCMKRHPYDHFCMHYDNCVKYGCTNLHSDNRMKECPSGGECNDQDDNHYFDLLHPKNECALGIDCTNKDRQHRKNFFHTINF